MSDNPKVFDGGVRSETRADLTASLQSASYESARAEYFEAVNAWWSLPTRVRDWPIKEQAAVSRFSLALSNLIGIASNV